MKFIDFNDSIEYALKVAADHREQYCLYLSGEYWIVEPLKNTNFKGVVSIVFEDGNIKATTL